VGWIAASAEGIAARAERELEALVGVSSPSGDAPGAEEVFAIVQALLPARAAVERVPCSSPDHAPDLVARLAGTGARRLLLLGHVDTVVGHDEHRPLVREQDRLVGSGAVDMKGGDVLAVGILNALDAIPGDYEEVALLLVGDEEWRTAPFRHVDRFEGFDACLCFEAGQLTPSGDEAVVVRRKAAGTLHVRATGLSAHSGSAPDRGRNALLALAAAAQAVADAHAPDIDKDKGLLGVVHFRHVVLYPGMNIQEAIAVFESAEAESLAVVDSDGERRPIGILTEAHAMRRYVEESEQRRREAIGEI